MCVCIFKKLHITARYDYVVILVIQPMLPALALPRGKGLLIIPLLRKPLMRYSKGGILHTLSTVLNM